jgi:hypothetical protein
VPVIASGLAFFPLLLAHLIKTLRRAETTVSQATLNQLHSMGRMDFTPLRLPVRAVFATDIWPLIPAETKPLKTAQDHVLARRSVARLVGVFDPNDELTAMFASKNIIK